MNCLPQSNRTNKLANNGLLFVVVDVEDVDAIDAIDDVCGATISTRFSNRAT